MNSLFRKDGQRILALWFPYLSADRVLRQRLGRSWRSGPGKPRPLVFSHRENNTQRIATLDEQAEALHLKPGTGLADARAIHPTLEVEEANPEADRRLLENLADWCDRYTPLVALDGPNGLFLDITGCAHLFGGEKTMLDDILTRLFHQGFGVRAGLASTPGAAWAAARFSLPPIAPGDEAKRLAALPLAALRLAPQIRSGLESVGLRTVGGIMNAPRAPLARRFGKELLIRLDQALGRIDEAISTRLPVAPLSVERHLPEPITLVDHIEELTFILAATLKTDLERRGEGARALELALFRVDGDVHRIGIGTSRPIREPRLVRRLFHERLTTPEATIDAGYGFDLVRLSVRESANLETRQTDLGGGDEEDEALAIFADRVRARLGREAVLQPILVETHIPERAAIAVPFSDAVSERKMAPGPPDIPVQQTSKPHPEVRAQRASKDPAERPIRLFHHPELIEVMAEIPEGPPAHFRWRRALHHVARAEGPERIAPEWWREGAEAATRDYFRVEDMDGRRYWLYRQGFYSEQETPPRWYMHGIFA